jgi:hypothetical protein
MMIPRWQITLVVLCLIAVPTVGAFELATSRGPGMGRTQMLSRSSASTLVNIPSGGIEPGEWHVESGYNRRFELRDLDQSFLAAAYRRKAITVALGLSQFGKRDLYAERTMKASLAYRIDSVSIGLLISGMLVDIGSGYGQLRAATVGMGASYRRARWFATMVVDNLTSPRLAENSVTVKPILSFYSEVIGKGSFSVTGRATFQEAESPQYALGQRISLSGGSAFFWGLSSAPLEYGGGIELHLRDIRLFYATTIHPVLGLSHTVAVAYQSRFFGKELGKS